MIVLKNVTLRRGVKVVLQGTSVGLNPGEKVGLVGRNGAGKSSLFALIAGRLHADVGDLEMPPRWRIGEVAQSMPETSQPATEFVLDGDLPLLQANQELARAEASGDGHAIAEAHMHLEQAGVFDARPRAQALLLGLGFRTDQVDLPVDSFSGGWRMRLQLARALMCPAELLLLDEPTNHLDLDALVWLEGWLKRFAGLMVVISHDREFLDAVTSVTLHLDDHAVTRYGGNYTAFEDMRAERLTQQQAAYSKQQEKVAQLQRFIDRFKAKASKAKQAQSRVKALARMERLAPVMMAGDFDFEFREPKSLPNPMLALRDLECGYGRNVIVNRIDRTVLAGQRIGILGANGQGKSTLVKTIARMLPPIGGTLTEGKGLTIGYFAQQELDLLSEDDTALQRMVRLAREVSPQAREQELRDFLGQFRFTGDMVHQTVGTLSGGERARLVLAGIVWQRPNLLLLDEPTNHLDLTTREALSIALNEFEGTVMLVSHDRALLREVCDEFWLVAAGGLRPFDGDLDDYQRWLLEVSRATARGTSPPPLPGPPPPAAPANKISNPASTSAAPGKRNGERKLAAQSRHRMADKTRPLRVEIAAIEQRMAALSNERRQVEQVLSSEGLTPAAIADNGRRLNHISAELTLLEERWLALQQQVETLTSA